MNVVYACGTEIIGMPSGQRVRVQKGTHWPADDPVVRSRPNLFTDDPRYGLMYSVAPEGYDTDLNPVDAEVEQATANPGEKRSARRSA